MRKIYVHDQNMHHCSHWGYRVLCLLLLALAIFSTLVALHNSKPICDDLVRNQADTNHELICEYGLGDIPEDKADVIIVKPDNN